MRRNWTDSETLFLIEHYPNSSCEELCGVLKKKRHQVYNKASALGLKKSEAFNQSAKSGRLTGQRGLDTRFKKGHRTWNKGMRGLDIGGKETRFKKGSLQGLAAKLIKPVGHERLSKDGYLERKIKADGPSHRRWRAVHILNWEAVHGALPKGHCITFKDGDKTNTDVANLEILSRAENMRRNTIHQYPKEIALAVQMVGALKRRINSEQQQQ